MTAPHRESLIAEHGIPASQITDTNFAIAPTDEGDSVTISVRKA